MPSFGNARVFKMAKGFTGRNKNIITAARARLEKALHYGYVGRKLKKRETRSTWIQQINAGTREHGVQYSTFVRGLAESNVMLNRKMLAELAGSEPLSFFSLVQHVKSLGVEDRRQAKIKANREAKAKAEADVISGVETKPWALTLRAEDLLKKRVKEALVKEKSKAKTEKVKAMRRADADKRREEQSARRKKAATALQEEALKAAAASATATSKL